MQHVIAWLFWSFLLNRRKGVIGSHRVLKLSLLTSVMNTSLFSRFHPISKIHWIRSRFSCFVRDERFVPTGFRSLLLRNRFDHFLLFIFQFSTGMFKTIKVTLQTNKTDFIILAIIFCLYTPVFAIIFLLNWKENRLLSLLLKLLSHLTYN